MRIGYTTPQGGASALAFAPRYTLPMNVALNPASEQVIQRELNTSHFTTPPSVVASALRLLSSHEDWLQENREAISERLELSFEQSRHGETYTRYSPVNSSQSVEQAASSGSRTSCIRARLQPCHKPLHRRGALAPEVRFESRDR